jgi:hypothetical protein
MIYYFRCTIIKCPEDERGPPEQANLSCCFHLHVNCKSTLKYKVDLQKKRDLGHFIVSRLSLLIFQWRLNDQ